LIIEFKKSATMIQTYFTQIKRIIEQYAASSFVLEAQMHFDMQPGIRVISQAQ
jgi:hypothetical protein